MRKFLKLRRTLVATAVMSAAAGKALADWDINGEVQVFIPFWYTLQEAVCRYMISSGCF
ncbi:MAG: hypothetical protein AAB402_02295 [Patescibacteria group bacterium]